MDISSLFSPNLCFANQSVSSKKKCLEFIAQQFAREFDLSEDQIFEAMVNREKLGSTGIGGGVALPHCRVSNVNQMHALIITLDTAIDFDSPDQSPADLIIALIAPEEPSDTHLKTLSEVASILQQEETSATLCQQIDNHALLEALKKKAS